MILKPWIEKEYWEIEPAELEAAKKNLRMYVGRKEEPDAGEKFWYMGSTTDARGRINDYYKDECGNYWWRSDRCITAEGRFITQEEYIFGEGFWEREWERRRKNRRLHYGETECSRLSETESTEERE